MKKQKVQPATSFADWIKDYGRTKLSRELSVTWNTVNFWMQGRNCPRIKLAQRIVEIAGGALTMDQIVAGKKS